MNFLLILYYSLFFINFFPISRPTEFQRRVDFMTAVASNNTKDLTKLIADGINVNNTPYIWSATHLACSYGRPEILNILLAAGGDVNERCQLRQYTPILHAAIQQNKECVRIMFQNGADVNCKTPNGVPLIQKICSTWDDIELVKDMISAGLSVGDDYETIIKKSCGTNFKQELEVLFRTKQPKQPKQLLDICTKRVRHILLQNHNTNLFVIVPQLHLPPQIEKILTNWVTL